MRVSDSAGSYGGYFFLYARGVDACSGEGGPLRTYLGSL